MFYTEKTILTFKDLFSSFDVRNLFRTFLLKHLLFSSRWYQPNRQLRTWKRKEIKPYYLLYMLFMREKERMALFLGQAKGPGDAKISGRIWWEGSQGNCSITNLSCWVVFVFVFFYISSRSVKSDSLWPHGLYSPWNSPGQNTGEGNLSLLQGIFPIQVSYIAVGFFTNWAIREA